jgi:hypothetical protein
MPFVTQQTPTNRLPPGAATQFMEALFISHELAVIMALQVICGMCRWHSDAWHQGDAA